MNLLNRITTSLFLFIALLVCLPLRGEATQQTSYMLSEQPVIRVGIWSNQSNVLVSADTDFSLVNARTKEILGKFVGKEKVSITAKDGQISINGKSISAGAAIRIEPALTDGDHYIEVNRKRYRGTMTIQRTNNKQGLTVVNALPLEQYLYGIVPDEMPSEWPLESIKAQSVAARTFALYNLHKHEDDGYDVCATVSCQVYGGKSSETTQATKAVDATYGQVILYEGKPIQASYHSSGGGFTENSENVWLTPVPYLRGVVDYDQKSPGFKWEKQLTPAELAAALSRSGYNIGAIKSIELSALKTAPMNEPDRGISGRVKKLTILGSTGTTSIAGNEFRNMLGLKSTLFDIQVILPVDKSVDVKITDSAGDREMKKIEINLPPRQEKGLLLDKQGVHRLSGRSGEIIVITGSGGGHGLGLSQWGAKAMAESASQTDPTYFKEILKHYYQSTIVKKVY